MKTLVIHAPDPTTDFLRHMYKDLAFTVIRSDIGDELLKKMIRKHDRILMLGHGTSDGLLGYGRYIIDSDFADDLRKKEVIAIWCYASNFVQKYKLKTPFSTGMFISETQEAYAEGINPLENQIENSNDHFSFLMKYYLHGKRSIDEIRKSYLILSDEVTEFNADQFYSNI